MYRLFICVLFLIFAQTAFGQCDTIQGEVRWRYWKEVPVYEWEIEDFYRLDRFPNGPDYQRTLYSLSTPYNYSDFYGSQVKGYIRTDVSGQVVFNVTGDDEVYFSLSTDNTPDNLVLINGDTSQVANLDTITLAANQSYYFELNHFEIGGVDYASVEWKADFLTNGIADTSWTRVGGDFIYDVCEPICEVRGTACNDNDASTANDQWDGNCNCVGDPISSNSCVGERGLLQTYVHANLVDIESIDIETTVANGAQPDTIRVLGKHFLDTYFATDNAAQNYVTHFEGFISPPVSGYYSFNITGSHQNIFYISSDDTPANKTANQLWTYWWAGVYEHDVDYGMYNPHDQTAENIYLEAGQYYYVELRHKGYEDDWQNYNLYWKTPYQTRDEWLRIPTFYFFDYTCETACVKANVPCNDNDPYTANDVWDGSCGCAGTPCVAPNCDDPSTSYIMPQECETTNEVSNRTDDAWLSCAPLSDAPNPDRNGRHWIQYDFGKLYDLGTTQVWNYNADGATNLGFEEVIIDYSTDGIYWEELIATNWALASGSTGYTGFVGPDFTGITARYVLISAADNGSGCRGLSKVAFNAIQCPSIQFNTPIIDQTLIDESAISVAVNVIGGEAAINQVDLYLDNNWIASDNAAPYDWTDLAALQNLSNGDYKLSAVATDANGTECELSTQIHLVGIEDIPCEPTALVLDTTDAAIYRTEQTITSTSTIPSTTPVHYIAETSITLMPGFHTVPNSSFTAIIAECTPASLNIPTESRVTNLSAKQTEKPEIKLFPNPVVNNFTIEINAHQAGTLNIQVYDVLGKELRYLNRKQLINKGIEQIEISAKNLTAGMYYCKIKIGKATFTKSFVRVDEN